jgi:hypothetical protein
MRYCVWFLLTFSLYAGEDAAYRLQITKYVDDIPLYGYDASCVAIGDKLILTAKHNIMEGDEVCTKAGFTIKVEVKPDDWRQCEIKRISAKVDLALLTVREKLPAKAEVAKAEKLLCVANPGGRGLENRAAEYDPSENAERVLTLETECGMSGGPVFNAAGMVVGIVVKKRLTDMKDKDVSYKGVAVWIGAIREFIDERD